MNNNIEPLKTQELEDRLTNLNKRRKEIQQIIESYEIDKETNRERNQNSEEGKKSIEDYDKNMDDLKRKKTIDLKEIDKEIAATDKELKVVTAAALKISNKNYMARKSLATINKKIEYEKYLKKEIEETIKALEDENRDIAAKLSILREKQKNNNPLTAAEIAERNELNNKYNDNVKSIDQYRDEKIDLIDESQASAYSAFKSEETMNMNIETYQKRINKINEKISKYDILIKTCKELDKNNEADQYENEKRKLEDERTSLEKNIAKINKELSFNSEKTKEKPEEKPEENTLEEYNSIIAKFANEQQGNNISYKDSLNAYNECVKKLNVLYNQTKDSELKGKIFEKSIEISKKVEELIKTIGKSFSDEITPIVNSATPIVNPTTPIVNSTTPIVNSTTPIVNSTTPIVNPTTPIVNPTTPTDDKEANFGKKNPNADVLNDVREFEQIIKADANESGAEPTEESAANSASKSGTAFDDGEPNDEMPASGIEAAKKLLLALGNPYTEEEKATSNKPENVHNDQGEENHKKSLLGFITKHNEVVKAVTLGVAGGATVGGIAYLLKAGALSPILAMAVAACGFVKSVKR